MPRQRIPAKQSSSLLESIPLGVDFNCHQIDQTSSEEVRAARNNLPGGTGTMEPGRHVAAAAAAGDQSRALGAGRARPRRGRSSSPRIRASPRAALPGREAPRGRQPRVGGRGSRDAAARKAAAGRGGETSRRRGLARALSLGATSRGLSKIIPKRALHRI